jgi:hypothetical protein
LTGDQEEILGRIVKAHPRADGRNRPLYTALDRDLAAALEGAVHRDAALVPLSSRIF